jgi:hypothetical protein
MIGRDRLEAVQMAAQLAGHSGLPICAVCTRPRTARARHRLSSRHAEMPTATVPVSVGRHARKADSPAPIYTVAAAEPIATLSAPADVGTLSAPSVASAPIEIATPSTDTEPWPDLTDTTGPWPDLGGTTVTPAEPEPERQDTTAPHAESESEDTTNMAVVTDLALAATTSAAKDPA